MPTTTYRDIRREIMRPLGLIEFTTSTNIPSGAKTVTSTGLSSRFGADDRLIGFFVLPVLYLDGSTPNNGLGTAPRRVTDYTASTGVLTYGGVQYSAETNDIDCDLYLFHPDDILRAFNRARQTVFPSIGIMRDIQTIVTGPNQRLFTVPATVREIKRLYVGDRFPVGNYASNLLLNANFESWSSATSPDNWTISGASSTVNQEVQTTTPKNYGVLEGSTSARIVRNASTATALLQTLNPASAIAIENVELNFGIWVYLVHSNSADTVKARISGAGVASTPVTGTAHGSSGWEYLEVSANTDKDAALNSNVDVGIDMPAGSSSTYNIYADEALCVAGPEEQETVAWIPVIDYYFHPPEGGASNGGQIELRTPLTEKRRLRFVGVDLLSSISVDTDTVEIDGELLEPVYNLTRSYLCEERAGQATGDQHIKWKRLQSEYHNKFEVAVNAGVSLRAPAPRIQSPLSVTAA